MTVNINASTNSKRIPIGRCEDNEATRVVFDCSGFSSAYGSGQATLLHRRSKEKISYIVQGVTQADDAVTWTVSSDDTAFSGEGTLQLMWTVNDVVAHSHFYTTITDPSLTDSSSEPIEVKSALQLLIDSCYTKEETDDLIAHMKAGSDWDANEGESGYIENRPFYSETVEGEEVVHQLDPKYISGKFITSGTGENSEIFNDLTNNNASRLYAHAEGMRNSSLNVAAHSEGENNTASGEASHVENAGNTASGSYSHGEGYQTTSSGIGSHSEGIWTTASNQSGHSEGYYTTASGAGSHSEGYNTTAHGAGSHSEGSTTFSDGEYSHVEGIGSNSSVTYTSISNRRNPGGYNSAAHVEGIYGRVEGAAGHVEGYQCFVLSGFGHAEGNQSSSMAESAHSEGGSCVAGGEASHSEGWMTKASAPHSHSEGNATTVISTANGGHAEGHYSESRGQYSHAEGIGSVATASASHVVGKYNAIDSEKNYAEIVGNGTEASYRSNARTLDWNGNESLAGSLTLGMNTNDEITITPAQLAKLLYPFRENHWESNFMLPDGYISSSSSQVYTESEAASSSATSVYPVYYLPEEIDFDKLNSLDFKAAFFAQNTSILIHKNITSFNDTVSPMWMSDCRGISLNYSAFYIVRASDCYCNNEPYQFPSNVKTVIVMATGGSKPNIRYGVAVGSGFIQLASLDWTLK